MCYITIATCFLVNFFKVKHTFSSLPVEVRRGPWLVWRLLKYNIVEAVYKKVSGCMSSSTCQNVDKIMKIPILNKNITSQ